MFWNYPNATNNLPKQLDYDLIVMITATHHFVIIHLVFICYLLLFDLKIWLNIGVNWLSNYLTFLDDADLFKS